MFSGAVDIERDEEAFDLSGTEICAPVHHAPENQALILVLGHLPRQACFSLKHSALAAVICIGCIAVFSVFVAHPAKQGAEMKGDHRRTRSMHIPLIQDPARRDLPAAQALPVPHDQYDQATSTTSTTSTSTTSTTSTTRRPVRPGAVPFTSTSTTSTTSTTLPSTTTTTLAVSTSNTSSTNSTNGTNTTSTSITTTAGAIAEDWHEMQAGVAALAMPSLFCWSYVKQHGPEWDILLQQHAGKLSIFRCNHWNVFTLEPARLSAEFTTNAIYGPPAKFYHDSWGNIIENTDVFVRVWDHIIAAVLHKHDQWTVKVDVDTVFFPQRLRDHLQCRGNPWQRAVFFRNCESFHMMQGPLEIFSQAAIDATASMEICRHAAVNLKLENQFMTHCMEKVGADGVEAYDLLADQYCDGVAKGLPVLTKPDRAGQTCRCDGVNASIAAIHPCKNADAWHTCWSQVVRRSDPSSVCSLSQLAPSTTPRSQDASAVASQAAALNDAAVSQNAAAFSQDVEGMHIIPMAR